MLPLALLVAALSAPPVHVGLGTADITPPVGWRLASSYDETFSTGVHDPLRATAVYLADGPVVGTKNAAVMVFCDLTGFTPRVADRVRMGVRRRFGVPVAATFVCATHAHTAPSFHDLLRDDWHRRSVARTGGDPHEPLDYDRFLTDRCLHAVADAVAAARPCDVLAAETGVPGVAFNRRFHMRDGSVRFNPGRLNPDILRPAGPVDERLSSLWFRAAGEDAPFGLLAAFPMHTAVFGGREFGADFPGVIRRELAGDFGPDFLAAYGQGTAGDVNHVDVTRAVEDDWTAAQSARIGRTLADALRASRADAVPVTGPLAAGSRVVPLPLRENRPGDLDRARRMMDRAGTSAPPSFDDRVDAYRILKVVELRSRHGDAVPAEVQAVRIGDAAVVALPHEVFVELGLDLRRRSPFPHTQIVTLSNTEDFYVPTRRAYAEGSYEVRNSPLAPGGGELLVDAAVRLLEQLRTGGP